MKKTLLLLTLGTAIALGANAQLKNLIKKDSTGKTGVDKLIGKTTGSSSSGLSAEEVAKGLKEALSVGANNAGSKLSAVDGFFKDAALKILMPQEAQKVERKLRQLGMGKLVDDAILAMNRSAEDASKSAAPIFVNAIKGMSIQDAFGILKGGNTAATDYLKGKTTTELTNAFRPVIEQSLQKTNATKYWNTLFSAYNRVSADKINPDLAAYVTEKALTGIFFQVGQEEQKIRKDPMARTSDLLKKVFAN
jgi:hypothetical protein